MVRLTVRVAPLLLMVSLAPHNDIKCVLSNKESNFNAKLGQNFHICSRSWRRGLTPSPLVSFLNTLALKSEVKHLST